MTPNLVAMAHQYTTNNSAGIIYAILALAESVDRLNQTLSTPLTDDVKDGSLNA